MKEEIAYKELELNLKHQFNKLNKIGIIGYEWDDGFYVFVIVLPKDIIK